MPSGKCPRCGLVNPAGLTSCRACGLSLSAAALTARQQVVQTRPATAAATAPPQVLTNPSASSAAATALPGWLLLTGTTFLRGVVMHIDGPYMAHRELNWAKLAFRAAVFLILLPILVSIAALWFAFVVVAYLVGVNRGGPGFISSVSTQVVGFFLTHRLLGPKAETPVRDVRIRDGTGNERLVRIQGDFVAGNVNVGDDITVEGVNRRGTIVFRRGLNHRTGSEIRVRRR